MLPLIVASIAIVPFVVTFAPLYILRDSWLSLAWLPFAIPTYALTHILTAGLFSLIGQRAVVPGVFPRQASHPVYGLRRIYGACWTAIYYSKSLYWLILTLPLLKRITFRLFGYRGSLAFTNYPDTWMRDLPLLRIGQGAYLANRATIGTNICLRDGSILVGGINVGEGALVGHLAMVGPGSSLGHHAELGTRCIVGLKSSVGDETIVGPDTSIAHKTKVGSHCKIGHSVFIGNKVTIGDGLEIPPSLIVVAETKLTTQSDVDRLHEQQDQRLRLKVDEMSRELAQDIPQVG